MTFYAGVVFESLWQGFSTFFVSRNILGIKKFPRNKIKKNPSEVVCFYLKNHRLELVCVWLKKIEKEVLCFMDPVRTI